MAANSFAKRGSRYRWTNGHVSSAMASGGTAERKPSGVPSALTHVSKSRNKVWRPAFHAPEPPCETTPAKKPKVGPINGAISTGCEASRSTPKRHSNKVWHPQTATNFSASLLAVERHQLNRDHGKATSVATRVTPGGERGGGDKPEVASTSQQNHKAVTHGAYPSQTPFHRNRVWKPGLGAANPVLGCLHTANPAADHPVQSGPDHSHATATPAAPAPHSPKIVRTQSHPSPHSNRHVVSSRGRRSGRHKNLVWRPQMACATAASSPARGSDKKSPSSLFPEHGRTAHVDCRASTTCAPSDTVTDTPSLAATTAAAAVHRAQETARRSVSMGARHSSANSSKVYRSKVSRQVLSSLTSPSASSSLSSWSPSSAAALGSNAKLKANAEHHRFKYRRSSSSKQPLLSNSLSSSKLSPKRDIRVANSKFKWRQRSSSQSKSSKQGSFLVKSPALKATSAVLSSTPSKDCTRKRPPGPLLSNRAKRAQLKWKRRISGEKDVGSAVGKRSSPPAQSTAAAVQRAPSQFYWSRPTQARTPTKPSPFSATLSSRRTRFRWCSSPSVQTHHQCVSRTTLLDSARSNQASVSQRKVNPSLSPFSNKSYQLNRSHELCTSESRTRLNDSRRSGVLDAIKRTPSGVKVTSTRAEHTSKNCAKNRIGRNRVWLSRDSRVFRRHGEEKEDGGRSVMRRNSLRRSSSSSGGTALVRSSSELSVTRMRANRAIQRSKAYFWSIKHRQLCTYFCRFGKCTRDNCPYVHDKDKVRICPQFLRGTCGKSEEECVMSHRIDKDKMPVCLYYLRGVCGRLDCPYLHVNVGRDAQVCRDFMQGHCSQGAECPKLHAYFCPDFTLYGECGRGPKCPLKHKKQQEVRNVESGYQLASTPANADLTSNSHDSRRPPVVVDSIKTPRAFKRNQKSSKNDRLQFASSDSNTREVPVITAITDSEEDGDLLMTVAQSSGDSDGSCERSQLAEAPTTYVDFPSLNVEETADFIPL